MLEFICTGFAELWGREGNEKPQNENMSSAGLEPLTYCPVRIVRPTELFKCALNFYSMIAYD